LRRTEASVFPALPAKWGWVLFSPPARYTVCMIKLWNTRTRALETFTPLKPPAVGLYTCGPTVYGPPHLGNLRSYIFADTLRRSLAFNGFEVKHVMNITDVGHLTHDSDSGEEKMDTAAKKEGLDPMTIAAKYTTLFKENLVALNISEPDIWAPATDHIPEQIALVEQLMANGVAYDTPEAVYFDVTKFPEYGALTGQKLSEKKTAARGEVETDPHKHNPADFALWFKRTGRFANHILHWPSPWGEGFPGWHIECSAMSMKYLGEQFDIHTGGVDHIMPHHSNEIAQSEAATGKSPFVNVWMHGEFLQLEKRMGKSEGNSILLQDVVERGIPPLAFRYFVLQAHYRSKLRFSWEALEAAAQGYQNLLDRVSALGSEARVGCAEFEQRFRDAINDDLNTPQAMAVMSELLKSTYPAHAKRQSLKMFDEVFGLNLLADREQEPIPTDVQKLLEQREAARVNKDFDAADHLRKEIEDAGFTIDDTPAGPRLRRS
jgi:cysteinyl-tRNA synthetase